MSKNRARVPVSGWLAAFILAAVVSGCGGRSEIDERETARRQRERQERETYLQSVRVAVDDEQVLEMVWQAQAHDGEGSNQDWVSRQLEAMRGTILMKRWNVRRMGSGICEVQYTLTLIDDDDNMQEHGWAWKVDTALQLVSSPNAIMDDQLAPRAIDSDLKERKRRATEAERSLE